MSKSIKWAYWLSLPEIKVFEAVMLLLNKAPTKYPPKFDEASQEYQKTFRLVVSVISDRSYFTPGSLNISDTALNGVRLIEVLEWGKSHGYEPIVKNYESMHLSKAPKPISPIKISNVKANRLPSPANWNKWKFIPKCQIWKAVCLTLNIEPDEEKHEMQHWLRNRKNVPFGFPTEFSDRLEIVLANVSSKGPIQPPMYFGALNNPNAEVMLCEVAVAAIGWGWTLPQTLSDIIKDQTTPSISYAESKDLEKPLIKTKRFKNQVLNVVLPYLQEVYKGNNFKNTTEFIRFLKNKSNQNESPFKLASNSDDSFFLKDSGKSLSHRIIQDNMKLIRN